MQILDFFLALSPVLWLIIALSGLKMAGHKACLSAVFPYFLLHVIIAGLLCMAGVLLGL